MLEVSLTLPHSATRQVIGALVTRPKRIYLARRHPELSHQQFEARWLTHGRLSLAFQAEQNWANIYRYVLCTAHEESDPKFEDNQPDGVGMLLFRDEAARDRHHSSARQREAMEADEDFTFAERVANTSLFVTENAIVDGPLSACVRFSFFKRRKDVSPEAFQTYWEAVQLPRKLALRPLLQRFVVNVPMPREGGRSWGLDVDCIEELWFASNAAMQAVCNSEEFHISRLLSLELCEETVVLTRTHVLHAAPI